MNKMDIETEAEIFLKFAKRAGYTDNFVEENYKCFLPSLPNGEYKKEVLKQIIKKRLEEEASIPEKLTLYKSDILLIKKAYGKATNESLMLLWAIICQNRLFWHKSGWVRLDWPKPLSYVFYKKEMSDIKIESLSNLRQFGFDMRVIGSNTPLVCFNIPVDNEEIYKEINTCDIRKEYNDVIAEIADKC